MALTHEQVIEFAQLKAALEAKALVECGAVLASRKDLVARGLELFYREGHLAGQRHAIERLCERHTAENEASPAKVAPV